MFLPMNCIVFDVSKSASLVIQKCKFPSSTYIQSTTIPGFLWNLFPNLSLIGSFEWDGIKMDSCTYTPGFMNSCKRSESKLEK